MRDSHGKCHSIGLGSNAPPPPDEIWAKGFQVTFPGKLGQLDANPQGGAQFKPPDQDSDIKL
jgi:hypothetical protein